MIELNITFLIQLVNFLIILAVLNVILYRPIRGILKQRSERMAAQMSEIERFTEEATQKLSNYEQSLEQARQEGMEIRNEFKEEGQKEEQEMLSKVSEEASAELQSVRNELTAQRKDAEQKLDKEVKEFAQKATDRILGQA